MKLNKSHTQFEHMYHSMSAIHSCCVPNTQVIIRTIRLRPCRGYARHITQYQDINGDCTWCTSRMHQQHCSAPSPVSASLYHNHGHALNCFVIKNSKKKTHTHAHIVRCLYWRVTATRQLMLQSILGLRFRVRGVPWTSEAPLFATRSSRTNRNRERNSFHTMYHPMPTNKRTSSKAKTNDTIAKRTFNILHNQLEYRCLDMRNTASFHSVEVVEVAILCDKR